MTNAGLKKAELFAAETNRVATVKQLYAVASHFAKISDPKLYKVYGAILMKFQAEHSSTPITWKDVNTFLSIKTVPKKFTDMIATKPVVKTTVVEKPKSAKKVSKKPAEKTASEMSVSEFQAKLKSLSDRMTQQELVSNTHEEEIISLKSKVATFEAKLDILMAWLETNPDTF